MVVVEQMVKHFLDLFILQIIIIVLEFVPLKLEVGQYLCGPGCFEGLDFLRCGFSFEFQ